MIPISEQFEHWVELKILARFNPNLLAMDLSHGKEVPLPLLIHVSNNLSQFLRVIFPQMF
jgi:hypothetical protein